MPELCKETGALRGNSQVGHLSVRAPYKSKGMSFSTTALDRVTDTHDLSHCRQQTVKLWLNYHKDNREGATQPETPHLCNFPLNGFFGVRFPTLLMTINDTWRAISEEETAETFHSQEHLFSSMCTDLLWRTFEATSSELPVSEGRGFLLCLVFLPLAYIYRKLKMKQTLLFWGSDQDSRNKRMAECRTSVIVVFYDPYCSLQEQHQMHDEWPGRTAPQRNLPQEMRHLGPALSSSARLCHGLSQPAPLVVETDTQRDLKEPLDTVMAEDHSSILNLCSSDA